MLYTSRIYRVDWNFQFLKNRNIRKKLKNDHKGAYKTRFFDVFWKTYLDYIVQCSLNQRSMHKAWVIAVWYRSNQNFFSGKLDFLIKNSVECDAKLHLIVMPDTGASFKSSTVELLPQINTNATWNVLWIWILCESAQWRMGFSAISVYSV